MTPTGPPDPRGPHRHRRRTAPTGSITPPPAPRGPHRRRTVLARLALAVPVVLAGCAGADGKTLRPPAGPAAVAGPTTTTVPATGPLVLRSPEVADGGPLPGDVTCDGTGRPPTLVWSGVPPEVVELAVVVRDTDVDGGLHWLVWGVDPAVGGLAGTLPAGAVAAPLSADPTGWDPPCPTDGLTHTYRFDLLTFTGEIGVDPSLDPTEIEALLRANAAATVTLVATYQAP